ncbi:MAG: hypothetical protein ACTSXA_12600 [Candidatus Heimdallarchaeota archaeon]
MNKAKIAIISSIVGLYIAIILLFFATTLSGSVFYNFVRLFALLGLLSMFFSAIIAPFQKELYQVFKKPFLKIHHTFTITGMTLLTAHPIMFAIELAVTGSTARESAAVFLPDFSSAYGFWSLAGRPAIYLIYIAFTAFFLRKVWKSGWRWLHGLNYIAFLFGVIHGIIIGTDFYNFSYTPVNIPGLMITILFLLMVCLTIYTFTLKRIQLAKRKKKKIEIETEASDTEENLDL